MLFVTINLYIVFYWSLDNYYDLPGLSFTDEETPNLTLSLPKCELHIAYGAATDGNLYKDLTTNGN